MGPFSNLERRATLDAVAARLIRSRLLDPTDGYDVTFCEAETRMAGEARKPGVLVVWPGWVSWISRRGLALRPIEWADEDVLIPVTHIRDAAISSPSGYFPQLWHLMEIRELPPGSALLGITTLDDSEWIFKLTDRRHFDVPVQMLDANLKAVSMLGPADGQPASQGEVTEPSLSPPAPHPPPAVPPPGWYSDPTRRCTHRWWSGRTWTEFGAVDGRPVRDPLPMN